MQLEPILPVVRRRLEAPLQGSDVHRPTAWVLLRRQGMARLGEDVERLAGDIYDFQPNLGLESLRKLLEMKGPSSRQTWCSH
jgi:hypothetical protein